MEERRADGADHGLAVDQEGNGDTVKGAEMGEVDGPIERIDAPGGAFAGNEISLRVALGGGVGLFPNESSMMIVSMVVRYSRLRDSRMAGVLLRYASVDKCFYVCRVRMISHEQCHDIGHTSLRCASILCKRAPAN